MRSQRRNQIVEKMFRACFERSCNASAKHLERVLQGLRLIILGRLILLRHLQSLGNHYLKHSNASTYGCASNQVTNLESMASRPLAIGPRSPHVRDIENSEEECGKCGLNADHHSGEAKHRMHLGRNPPRSVTRIGLNQSSSLNNIMSAAISGFCCNSLNRRILSRDIN